MTFAYNGELDHNLCPVGERDRAIEDEGVTFSPGPCGLSESVPAIIRDYF